MDPSLSVCYIISILEKIKELRPAGRFFSSLNYEWTVIE